jgi:hypothetical protein
MTTPIFAPLPPCSHLTDSIDCLVAVLTNGDRDDCNLAAQAQVELLEQAFDGIVEMVDADPRFEDVDASDLVYYAIMEAMGHGVRLGDHRDRWSAEQVDIARDPAGPINQAVKRLVSWAENALESYPSAYKLRVSARVTVYTEASAADGDSAASITIPATSNDWAEWSSWTDGLSYVPDEMRAEDEPPLGDTEDDKSEEYTPLEFVRLLDELGAEFVGSGWSLTAEMQRLLDEHSYRRLPIVEFLNGSDEVISATLDITVEAVKLNSDDPDCSLEEIEAGRDSVYKPAADAAKESQ